MSGTDGTAPPVEQPSEGERDLARRILHAVRGIRYGSGEIVIHDGKVVQIERKEKYRVENGPARKA